MSMSNPVVQIIALGRSPLISAQIAAHLLPHGIVMPHFLTPSASLAHLLRELLSAEGCGIDAVVLGAIFNEEQVEALRTEVGAGKGGPVKSVPWLMLDAPSREKVMTVGGKGGIWAMPQEDIDRFTKDTAEAVKRGLEEVRKAGKWGQDGVWEYA